MAENDGKTPAGAGAATAGTGTTGGANGDAHLEALQALRGQVEGLGKLMGRFGSRIGNLEKGRTESGRPVAQHVGFADLQPEEDDPVQRELAATRAELDQDREERALDRFLRVSGISVADLQEVAGRLRQDEAVYHVYKRGPRGEAVLDHFASYDKVWKELQLERLNASRATAEQQRIAQDRERQAAAQRAGIVGVGTTGLEGDDQPLDIASMSSEEYLKKVLIPRGLVDPNDPPNPAPYAG